jgi:hypothetical protein
MGVTGFHRMQHYATGLVGAEMAAGARVRPYAALCNSFRRMPRERRWPDPRNAGKCSTIAFRSAKDHRSFAEKSAANHRGGYPEIL